jgi:preprotein translocase subunit SecG
MSAVLLVIVVVVTIAVAVLILVLVLVVGRRGLGVAGSARSLQCQNAGGGVESATPVPLHHLICCRRTSPPLDPP